jgi:hypothetical protein
MRTSEKEAPHAIEYYTRSLKFEDSLRVYHPILLATIGYAYDILTKQS